MTSFTVKGLVKEILVFYSCPLSGQPIENRPKAAIHATTGIAGQSATSFTFFGFSLRRKGTINRIST